MTKRPELTEAEYAERDKAARTLLGLDDDRRTGTNLSAAELLEPTPDAVTIKVPQH